MMMLNFKKYMKHLPIPVCIFLFLGACSSAPVSHIIGQSRTTTNIKSVLEKPELQNKIYAVYQQRLGQQSQLKGNILYSMTVTKLGKVVECKVAKSTVGDSELEESVRQILYTAEFGEVIDAQAVTFTYPLKFSPE